MFSASNAESAERFTNSLSHFSGLTLGVKFKQG